MDASYLVEPEEGLWLVMIDANVFVPIDGSDAFEDSTSAGWNALLKHKAFLLSWIADLTARANASGKRLVVFSHYPVLDPLDGTREEEMALIGPTETTGRIPRAEVGAALMAAGVRLHLSGHLHVNDTACLRADGRSLVNVAVPFARRLSRCDQDPVLRGQHDRGRDRGVRRSSARSGHHGALRSRAAALRL